MPIKEKNKFSVSRFKILNDIRPLAAVLAGIIFFIAASTKDPLNQDGILYLRTAEAFVDSGWGAAMALYPWPFYSMLIAGITKLTHLPFEQAAYVLNAAMVVMIVTTFITLLKELGASRAVQFIGAVLILSHPRLHHYHSYIIRGFGYWAFLLLSLLFLIRYYRQLLWKHALGWGISIGVSILFRPEGIVPAVFAPLALFLRADNSLWRKIRVVLKANGVNAVIFMMVPIWYFSSSDRSDAALGRVHEILFQFKNGLMFLGTNLNAKAATISKTVLNDYSDDLGLIMTLSGLAGIYFYKLIKTIWPLHALLCVHAGYKRLIPAENGVQRLLQYYAALNLLIPAIFLGQQFFISYRYLMPASLILLIWAPFSIDAVFQEWRAGKGVLSAKRLLFPGVATVLFVVFVYAFIPSRSSKAYITSAGIWLQDHTPQHARIYSNIQEIDFYARRRLIFWNDRGSSANPPWTSEDFIAWRVRQKDNDRIEKFLRSSDLKPVKVFENRKGDKVIIVPVLSLIGKEKK